MNTVKILMISAFTVSIIFTGCQKEELENNDINIENEEVNDTSFTDDLLGFGNRKGVPTGASFNLPENVEFSSEIKFYPKDTSINAYGVGRIDLYFSITNHNTENSTITFPEGLIFIPDVDSAQKVMTVYPVEILIPQDSTRKIRLDGFCINKDKSVLLANNFIADIISDNGQVDTLTDELKMKNDSTLLNYIWEIQEMVWNISDRDGLTQEDINNIRSW